jgi:hypothetical protein
MDLFVGFEILAAVIAEDGGDKQSSACCLFLSGFFLHILFDS